MTKKPDGEGVGPPIPKEAIRTPQEVRQMMKEVSWLSKVFSGRHNVKVVALPGEGPWTCGIDQRYAKEVDAYMQGKVDSLDDLPPEALVPSTITVRESDFYRDSPTELRRKTRHEAAHAAHSNFRLLFEGSRKAKDEGYLPSTYMSAANGPEDGWVNAMAAGESQAALEDFRNGYQEKLAEISAQLLHDPLSRQFGVNAINYWLTGKDVEGLDPRVIKIMEQVRPALDKFFTSNSAKENSVTFNNEIWPLIRDLEKEDISDEKLRQAANQASNQTGNQGGESSRGQGQGGSSQGQSSELGQQIQQELGQSPGSGESGEDQPIDLSKLSPETIEKLKQQIEAMDPQEKAQLEAESRREVDRRQSQKLNEEAPQIIQMEENEETGEFLPKIQGADPNEIKLAEKKLEKFENEEEAREKQEMEAARREEEQRQVQLQVMQEKQKKIDEMKKNGFDESEEANYDKYKQLEREIDQEYRELRQELTRMFPRQVKIVHEGYYNSGRPDPLRVAKAFPTGDNRFYERKAVNPSQQVNLSVWMALDISGTMSGTKMEESVKNIIMWSKLCEEFSIPIGIVLFGNSAEILKNSNQAYSDPEQKIKANLIQKTNNPNQSTNMGAAVEIISNELKESRRRFPGMQGIALFVTDGQPNTGLVDAPLRAKIEEVQSAFSAFAFGLGSDMTEQQQMQQMLSFYFGQEPTIVPREFSQLPKETAKVMSPIMRRLSQRLRY